MADALARSCKAQHEGRASREQGVYMGIQYLLSLWVSPSPPPLHLGPGMLGYKSLSVMDVTF